MNVVFISLHTAREMMSVKLAPFCALGTERSRRGDTGQHIGQLEKTRESLTLGAKNRKFFNIQMSMCYEGQDYSTISRNNSVTQLYSFTVAGSKLLKVYFFIQENLASVKVV